MDGSRKHIGTFSMRSPFNGTEMPADKTIKPTQVHRDFLPFRTTAAFIVSPSLRNTPQMPEYPKDSRNSPAQSLRSENIFRGSRSYQQEIPAQLLACNSFALVPVQTHAFATIRSNAIQLARERVNSMQKRKMTSQRAEPKRCLDFEPYTLEDYRKLKPTLAQTMGGLGPFMIGRPEWDEATQKLQRTKDFSAAIRRSNTFA